MFIQNVQVNYILLGLQVGLRGPKSTRWKAYFTALMKSGLRPSYIKSLSNIDTIWNFIKTYIKPFGVMHGEAGNILWK